MSLLTHPSPPLSSSSFFLYRYEEALTILSLSDTSIVLDRGNNQSTVIGNLKNVPNEASINNTDDSNNNSSNSNNSNSSDNSTSSSSSSSNSSNSDNNSNADSKNRSEGLDIKVGPTPGPGSVPLTPQRVKLLTALYERTGRGGKAEELYVRAVQEGLSSYYDLGKYYTCALYMCTCMLLWAIKNLTFSLEYFQTK
jgi:hypothetical protein